MGQKAQVWLIWFIAVWVAWVTPGTFGVLPAGAMEVGRAVSESAGVMLSLEVPRDLFPWLPGYRWRKLALAAYRRWRRAYRRARYHFWVAYGLAKSARQGVLTLAWVVDRLTRSQLRRQLGALPVLYAVLEELKVEAVINRYCPSRSEVSHGTVALVLILNRLHAPRAVWRVADWLAQTILVHTLGVDPAKFKKDRLLRTLDALAPHCQAIWQTVVNWAIARYQIDLSVIFYDLTAFILHGEYQESDLVEFGFAHNTPSGKRKVKAGLNSSADGNIPLGYQGWPGSEADKATVEQNMQRLAALLKKHGHPLSEGLVVGDRAMLDDRIALLYDEKGLHYLAGLAAQKRAHRQLIDNLSETELRRRPLTAQRGRYGYWSYAVDVPFAHEGQRATHRGLVILSGPMRFSHYRTRAAQFRALWQALREVQAKADAGKPRYRTPGAVQARAATQGRNSPVGKFVTLEASQVGERIVLRWQVKVAELKAAMARDGRYLIVTNDPSLSYQRMFDLYRAKDGVEKDFRISKSQLKVSPLFLHKDERIQAMLLINMLALLAYTILERQARQSGVALTTRRIIEQLDSLCIIETNCWDGSRLFRLTPVSQEQADLIRALRHALGMPWAHALPPQALAQLPRPETVPVSLEYPAMEVIL
jgi:hypothetical protein